MTPTATTRTRFLTALEHELATPALCSCARNMAASPFYERPCANNCALYNAPAKRAMLLTSVYKQQQLARAGVQRRVLASAAASPAS